MMTVEEIIKMLEEARDHNIHMHYINLEEERYAIAGACAAKAVNLQYFIDRIYERPESELEP